MDEHKKFTRKALQQALEEYFADTESVKSLPGLALALKVDGKTLEEWMRDPKYSELKLAGIRVEKELVENALRGKYNATTATFLLKTVFGYREKAEENGPAGPIQVEVSDELRRFAV